MESQANHSEPQRWYVMRVTYQRELLARKLLEDIGIESFVATARVRCRKGGVGVGYKEVSLLHNYIFIHSTESMLKEIKTHTIPYLRYLMANDESGRSVKQFVESKQMEDFMAICRSEGARILSEQENLLFGDRVRIVSGPLSGVEGYYVGSSSRRGGRVVVRIEGVAAVATATYPTSAVEKILPPSPFNPSQKY